MVMRQLFIEINFQNIKFFYLLEETQRIDKLALFQS